MSFGFKNKKIEKMPSPTEFNGKYFPHRKTSLFTLRKQYKGSMTVEASLVLPIFVFAFLTLMSIIKMLHTYAETEFETYKMGRELALYTSITEEGTDYVNICLPYEVSNITDFLGIANRRFYTRFYSHRWIGYDVPDTEDETVYITAKGEVYHKSLECSHLKVSIKGIAFKEIGSAKNKDGEKYDKCYYCCNGDAGNEVYVTDYGSCYHYDADCQGLKRNVISMTLTEAEKNYRPCSTCGN